MKSNCKPTKDARIGSKMAAVAVLDVISVKKVTITETISTTTKGERTFKADSWQLSQRESLDT